MGKFCKDEKFVVLCVDEAFDRKKPMRLQHQFDLLRLQREWAAASDILRYELLYRFGGVYADTDVSCKQKIRWSRVPEVPDASRHRFGMGQMNNDGIPAQAALFSTSGNLILKTILDFVEKSFSSTTERMLRYTPQSRPQPGEHLYTQRRMDDILARTGPTAVYVSVIVHFFGTDKDLHDIFPAGNPADPADWHLSHEEFFGLYSDDILRALVGIRGFEHFMPAMGEELRSYFREEIGMGTELLDIGSEASWLGVRRMSTETIDDARVALTVLLFRLRADPTILDLVPFEALAGKPSMVVEILDALLTGFASATERVRVAQLGYESSGAPPRADPGVSPAVHRLLSKSFGFDTRVDIASDTLRDKREPMGRIALVHRVDG